jgi:hypothetical protein
MNIGNTAAISATLTGDVEDTEDINWSITTEPTNGNGFLYYGEVVDEIQHSNSVMFKAVYSGTYYIKAEYGSDSQVYDTCRVIIRGGGGSIVHCNATCEKQPLHILMN